MLERYQPTTESPWDLRRVWHLHRRAGFAANWNQIKRDLNEGPDAAVDRLLGLFSESDDTSSSAERFEEMSSVIGDAAVASNNASRLKAWWLYRMLFTPAPLTERLTLMWHNHFATSNLKVEDLGAMRRQNEIFRQHGRGLFGDLFPMVIKDPALLIWLDAEANRKEHPNENLAREIMELFSLGVGNYSETDIKEAARSLTGWSVNKGEFRHFPNAHDEGKKVIFGHTGNWNGDDLLRMLLDHVATPKRIAFRICELFMGETAVHDRLIDELANGLRERDLDIGWAVETVLRSEAFFSADNLNNRVLGPVEFVIGAARSLEMTDPPASTLLLAEATATLGQDLFYPPNVFGWPGGRAWLSSRTLIARANFAAALVGGQLHAPAKPFDAVAFAESHGFTGSADVGSFYSQLLLGQSRLPTGLQEFVQTPDRLVTAILASPEAQLT